MICAWRILVFHPDVAEMGTMVAEAAAEMGATTVVHYSFPRHMAQPLNIARHDNMKAKCEELGLTFVDGTSPDPQGDAGIAATQQYILEDVPHVRWQSMARIRLLELMQGSRNLCVKLFLSPKQFIFQIIQAFFTLSRGL